MRDRLEEGERVARVSVATNVFLSALKFAIAWMSGSVALMADALNAFSDVFSSLTVVFGLHLAQREPTEEFPYGFYRAETIASLIVSGFIVMTGWEIFTDGVEKILSPTPLQMALPVVATAALSAAVLLWLSRLKERTGREINSMALINEGKHSMADVFASLVVGVGVVSTTFGLPQAEGVAAVLVSLFVLKTGLEQAWSSVLVLMDALTSPEMISRVEEIAMDVKGVKEVRKVRLRRSGPFLLGEMEIGVSASLQLEKAHEISERVEAKVKKEMPEVDHLIIHLEPSLWGQLRVALPVEGKNGLESKVAERFGQARRFVFVDTEGGRVISVFSEENPSAKKKGMGIETAKFLLNHKVDVLIDGELGRGPFDSLKKEGVLLYLKSPGTVSQNLNRFLLGKLKKMEEAEGRGDGQAA